jgi:hypothetical protein
MKKQIYIKPYSEVLFFEYENFIATSGNGELEGFGEGDPIAAINNPSGDKFLKHV